MCQWFVFRAPSRLFLSPAVQRRAHCVFAGAESERYEKYDLQDD